MSRINKFIHLIYLAACFGLLFCFIILGCDLRYGFVESIFQLAPESRFPRWFDVSGYQRKDLSMTITCYVVPFGGKAQMVVYGPAPERKKLMEKAGKQRWHPLSEKEYDKKYPNYSIITVDGIGSAYRCQSYTFHRIKSASYVKVADLPR